MHRFWLHWKHTAGLALFFCAFLLPSPGSAESLKDGVILRNNADIFLKNGSTVECRRFFWLVSAADYIQCDKGDHAVEVKLKDVDFEKTFGPDLAREYAAMKGDLTEEQEKSRREQEESKVTYESRVEEEPARNEASGQEETKQEAGQEAQPAAAKKDYGEVWTMRPGEGVGWINFGTPYETIVERLGKTIMESPLPPDGKHQRYAQYGIEFWYNNDKVTTIRVGTSTDKEYSKNKYKIKGVGPGSPIDDVVAALGRPDHITNERGSSIHKYVYKNGIYFAKYKSRDVVWTVTVFPRKDYDYYSKK